MTRKIFVRPVLLLVLAGTLVLASCDNFFSDSWGTARSYDPDKITLTDGNLDLWIKNARGNPELAAAITRKIIDEIRNKSGAEKVKFQEAGMKLAVEASGVGASIISSAADVINKLENNEDSAIKDILSKIQSDFASGGPGAASNIADLVTVSSSNTPAVDPGYAAAASASDIGMATMVLALAVMEKKGINAATVDDLEINHLTTIPITYSGGDFTVDSSATKEERALAAYLNLISHDSRFDDNPLTSGIKGAFKG
ncbi:MAG: hypothetical protein LBG84_04700 [Treponema sp.]|jgi:hypothetical protein|nr:hypothetical protein [Treponema sp.]